MLQVHRILRCFLFFASVVFAPITLLARQNDSDSLEISVLGRVTDQDGQAISNAHVILIAHRATFYNDSIFPNGLIRIGFVAKSTPGQSRKSNAFSWCDAQVDAGGKFEIAYWTGGQLDFQGSLPLDFPYVLDRAQTRDTILAESNEISLKLLPAMLLRGKLVDADSGQGLEGVFVDYYDRFSRLAVSQADGSFQLWCESNKVGLYPRETYGETIVVGDGSVIRPESLPENGVLTLAPTKMRSMTTAQGRVVDEQGHPVAGMSIECVSKVGRFDSTTTLLSDRDGNFQFFGLPDGIRVSISANTGTRGSKKPLRTELTNDARVELTISELPSAQFVGSVVDHRNTPIAGASVSIKTAITLTPETFGGADRQAAGPNDADDTVTDASGQFQSPPTTSLTEERSIRVTAPGYVEYRSGWHRPNVTDTNVGQPRIELGTIGLTAQPKQETVSIHIVDRETGTPIVGAKIVTLGALCGQTRQSLTATSKTEWIWVDTPKILAVRSEGYIPFIEAVGSMLESNFTVRLTKDPKHIPPRIPSPHSDDHLVLAADELLALVPEPAETDTYFKKLNYYPLLGMARPEKLVEKFEAVKLAGASEMEIQVYMRELLQ